MARLFSELFGTFLLVLVAAGGGMMSQAFPDTISRTAAVVAPGLMVMGIILFMGKVSGAHLNPAVSVAFALRGTSPGGGAQVHRGPARRGRARRLVPPGRGSRVPPSARTTRRRTLDGRRLPDGAGPHVRAAQRDPRDRVGRPEHRHHRCGRCGRYIALAGCGGARSRARRSTRHAPSGPTWWRPTSTRTGCTLPGHSPVPLLAVGVTPSSSAERGGGRAGSGAAQGALQTEVERPDKRLTPSANDPQTAAPRTPRPGAMSARCRRPRVDAPDRRRNAAARGEGGAGEGAPGRAIPAGPPPPTGRTRSACSRSRRRPGCPTSCRSGTAACSHRRSPSTGARRCLMAADLASHAALGPRRPALRRRAPVELRRVRLPRAASCCSTSTTSTRPSPARSSGT